MEIDKTTGTIRLSTTEQAAFELDQAEWSIDRPFELVDAMQKEVDRLLSGDPTEYATHAHRNKILGQHAAGYVLRTLVNDLSGQLKPYLDEAVLIEAEQIIRTNE